MAKTKDFKDICKFKSGSTLTDYAESKFERLNINESKSSGAKSSFANDSKISFDNYKSEEKNDSKEYDSK